MNFDFSEDQRRLQEEIRKLLAAHSASADVRRVLEGEEPYCREAWRQLAGLGALGIAVPEALGGAGLGHLELCLLAEEAGRALVALPLTGSIYLAGEAISRAGSEAQRAQWLPRLASGECIATAALDGRAHTALSPDTPRLVDGRLWGALNAVPDAMVADVAVVLASGRLVLVNLGTQGVTRTPQQSLDPTRPLGQLAFDDVAVELLAAPHGAQIAATVTQGAAVLLAFEAVGGAERALHAARDFVLQRRAFGRVVGGFQAVKHKLADLYAAIEIARAHAYYGAWALATGAAELPRAAAAARVSATTAYSLAAEESLHLHGGIGFTWEMDCHLHLRRARWLGQIIGSEHLWRGRLADALIAEAA